MNKFNKTLLIASSLVLIAGAGCTQSTTTTTNETVYMSDDTVVQDNTNTEQGSETANTNTVVETDTTNVNAAVSDTNTNETDDTVVDTSDWLTYTSEEYGFSFRYPLGWTITEKGRNVNVYSNSKSAELKTDPMTSADLYISIDETSSGPIKDLHREKINYRLVQDNEDRVIIAYEQANEFADSVNTYYYIQSADETKTISATFFQNSLQADVVISIIQTIDFNTKQASETETSDWLTYTNEEFGLSFKYPNSMTINESYILTSNLNTTNTYSLIQLSLQTKYPSPVFSVNVALNNIDTTVDQIMAPDIASSASKSDTILAGKNLTAINLVGPEGREVIYAYEVDNKTILISTQDNSEYAQILNTIQFTK